VIARNDPPATPKIEFHPDSRITVSERIWAGAKECTDVRIDSIEYDGDTVTLVVGNFQTGGACDGYRRALRYEASVTFEGSLPRTVIVKTHTIPGEYDVTTVQRPD
jgi:hypothetical protein